MLLYDWIQYLFRLFILCVCLSLYLCSCCLLYDGYNPVTCAVSLDLFLFVIFIHYMYGFDWFPFRVQPANEFCVRAV